MGSKGSGCSTVAAAIIILGVLSFVAFGIIFSMKPDPESKAESAALEYMKDPDSAEFSGLYVVRKPADKDGMRYLATCGWVNAKNGFDAYGGKIRFVALQREAVNGSSFDTISVNFEDPSKTGTLSPTKPATVFEDVYWNSMCVDAEHPATYSGVYNTGSY